MTSSSFSAKEMLRKLRPTVAPTPEAPIPSLVPEESKEATAEPQRASSSRDSESDDETVHKDAQLGVQRIEATTRAWSKSHLILAYFMYYFESIRHRSSIAD